MKAIFTLAMGLTLTLPMFAQQDFKQKYDQFRFGLHPEIEHTDFRLSAATAESIANFLNDHKPEIRAYRLQQLQLFERASLESPLEYKSIDPDDLESIKSDLVWYDSKVLQSQMQLQGYDHEASKHIESMLTLMSVDPIYKINLINGQVMSVLLMQHQELTTKEMASIYGKIGMAGVYLSTAKINDQQWRLVLNNYYQIFDYHLNVETGSIELMDVRTRL